MHFKEWLYRSGRSIKTVNHYAGAVYGILTQISLTTGDRLELTGITDVATFDAQAAAIRATPLFADRNTKGNNMYGSALNRYREYLLALAKEDGVTLDIQEAVNDTKLTATERRTVIAARLGQGRYRADLIDLWHGRCSVTGYDDPRLLIASHIKPWYAADHQERIDPYNGLLLTPNLDKAFDAGLITFDCDNGRIALSAALRRPEALGIDPTMRLTHRCDATAAYLDYHRERVFIRC